MDKMKLANQLSRIESLIPKAPKEISSGGKEDGVSFKETLQNSLNEVSTKALPAEAKSEIGKAGLLKFSNHAIERMQTRGISYSPESLHKLDEAVKKAAAKGSKDTLVLMDDSALIVSVKNNTVVTVMDKSNLKENVFTNIDSTVVL